MKTIYQTCDGEIFDDRAAGVDHENELFEIWVEALIDGRLHPRLTSILRHFSDSHHLTCDSDSYHGSSWDMLKAMLKIYWEDTGGGAMMCKQSDGKRYRVVRGSESGHCCFEATVIDTEELFDGKPDYVCECFDPPRAHAIADAMNTADEATLNETGPVFQDRCGKEFDVLSALLYNPGGDHASVVVHPCQAESDINTGRWELCARAVTDREYLIYGNMFEKHPRLLKLEASGEEIINAD